MRRPTKTIITPTLIVFFAVMVVVITSSLMTRNSVRQELENTVADYTQSTEDGIRERLNIYEVTLRAGLGLVSGNPNLTQAQWEEFIHTSTVLERYPSAQGISYARVVPASELSAFLQEARAKVVPEFTVSPEGQRRVYSPLTFIAPMSEANRKVLGFDISTETTRAEALKAATDTGEVVLSNSLQSLLDTSTEGRSFLFYAPQFKEGMRTDTLEQRRAAIAGYAYVGFRVNKFLENITPDQGDKNIAFIADIGNENNPLFKSQNYDEVTKGSYSTRSSKIDIGGSDINITYAYSAGGVLPQYLTSRPIGILIFGTIMALLIAYTVWLILRAKANELLLEQERGINEAKDNLLSLASHQLRTPATGVKQYLGLLLQGFSGELTPQQRTTLEKAYEGNERQLKTINDVLYLARLGSGRIVLTQSNFSVTQVIKDILRELDDQIKEKQHKVSVQLPKQSKIFNGDEHMIRMAIENLITNAIKYTHRKGKISVKLTQGKDLKIMVEDNGIGIPEDQQKRMFEQFERIDNDLSIAVGGSGIGLYVVQHIADLHGGHVEVNSQVGIGSKFTLVMPLKEA